LSLAQILNHTLTAGVPQLSGYIPSGKRAKDNSPSLAAELVKGAGMTAMRGPNPKDMKPKAAIKRGETVLEMLTQVGRESNTAVGRAKVTKRLNDNGSAFGQFLNFTQQMPQNQGMNQLVAAVEMLASQLGKSISITSPLATSFAPYDLVAPSRLIYPVYSPFRNKLPRLLGQGVAHRAKVITGITGSQTGGQATKRWSIGEFDGGSFNSWPNSLPPSGSQTAVDVIVPYKFFGLTEAASWLAQFSGQGFEDISALVNLILLQEAMLAEEHQIIAGIYNNLSTPSAPGGTARTAATGETAITGPVSGQNVYIVTTATNYYGETVASTAATVVWTTGQVIDVAISPVAGAQQYNIYVSTGTVTGTDHLMASGIGGHKFTLQGALPTGGTTAPTADTGTGSNLDYDGLLAVMTGNTQSGTYPATGFTAGYINQTVASSITTAVLYDALAGLYDNTSSLNTSSAGGFRADPQELVGEAVDLANFSQNVLSQASGGQQAFNIFITEDELDNVRAGAAISQFVNPFTRSVIRIVVHPFLTQGTAMLFSYQVPMSFSNVGNAWEIRNVQDYVSVAWPVIDPTFRWSIFLYGALFATAPQLSGLLQGLNRTGSAAGGNWT
jgi:hypothetical protein